VITRPITSKITQAITRAISGGSGGGIPNRYFSLLDPVLDSHYVLSTPIDMQSGDTASIEFVAPVGIIGTSGYIFGGSGATGRGYVFLNTLGTFQVNEAVISTLELDGVGVALNSAYPLDGKLHTLKVTYSSTATIGFIGCRYTVSLFFDGILANAKFTDNSGTPVTTTFKLDTATGNVEQSVEGNNTLTYVNILESNREEYQLSNDETQWNNLNPINLPTVIEVAESAPVPSGQLTFLSLEEIASPRLFGAGTHQFNLTAPAETDGVVFVTLVQKKNQGVNITDIKVDGGAVVDALHSVDSNPNLATNQLTVFEDKTFVAGAHTVDMSNLDGMDGCSIVAVYYKNYTGFTGNFTSNAATGVQAQQLILGNANWAVTTGNRGLNIIFAGGLTNLVSETANAEYSDGIAEYGTTDVNDNNFNGKLKTAVDLDFATASSNQQWAIDWDGAGVTAEVMVLAGELSNT